MPTIDRGVAQLASAHVWGTWGRKFESSHPDQNQKRNQHNHSWLRFFLMEIFDLLHQKSRDQAEPENAKILSIHLNSDKFIKDARAKVLRVHQ